MCVFFRRRVDCEITCAFQSLIASRVMKMRCQFFSCVIFLFIASRANCQSSNVYRLSDAVTPSYYDLSIQSELSTFNGTVTIDFYVNRATSVIEMHCSYGLTINGKASVKSSDAIESESTYILYEIETEKITIGLDRTLAASSNHSITLSYQGRLSDDMKGLYSSSYYNGIVKSITTTFSAAAYARRIFPCFDEPALKARFRLKVTCRSNFISVANTKIVNVEYWNDIFGTWMETEFDVSPPMSTYLLAFTISDFVNMTSFDEQPVFSVYASSKEYRNMEFALDVGRDALKALEEYTGHAYQLDKMDFIAIDDFLYGAMENWGFISYKTSRIVNPQGMRNRRRVQDIISIISHEIVHQHFGNQVTCEYWDYVWLNEGFASYLEYVIADMISPDFRILEQFSTEDMHPVMINDVKPKTHPMTRPVITIEEIAKIYDFVAYPKAASVIRMIEQIMTPQIFRKGLNLYLEERKFQAANDRQLYDALERSRPLNSSESYPPIPDIFHSWADYSGFPILNVNYSRDEKVVKISQEQFVPLINETESSNFYILYNFVTAQRSASDFWQPEKSEWHWIKNETDVVHDIEGNPEWMVFNLQQTGYYRVNYNEHNWNAIINVLNGNTFHIVHVLNRAQLLDDSFNLAKAGYLDFSIALNLLTKYLHREYELMPITDGFRTIEFLLTYLDEQPFYADLLDILQNVLDEIYVRVNNASHPEHPRTFPDNYHQLIKLKVNLFACKFGAFACIEDARSEMFLYDLVIQQPTADERQYLYCGALNGDLATSQWTKLKGRLADITKDIEIYRDNQDEITDILYAFSNCDDDMERVELLLIDIFNKSQPFPYQLISKEDATYVIGNLIKVGSKHRELVMEFYSDHFELVNGSVPLTSVLSIFAEAINTETHLEQFKELGIVVKVDVDESVREIEKNLAWMQKKVPEISTWVKNEKGGAGKLKFSSMIFILSIILVVLQ